MTPDTITSRLKTILEHPRFIQFITALIVINAVTLGLETSPSVMQSVGPYLLAADQVILAIFVAEIAAKLYCYRLSFFRSGWNVFDLSVVAIALIPATGPLAALRAFRVLRVLRLFSVVPQMRRVVNALFYAIPGMGSVLAVLLVVFYVGAVLSTKLFGTHPDPDLQEWFGTISASMFTLFQIMTLEGWSDGIVRPTLEHYPFAWAFFVPFIIITSFAVLNLFIGIIVDAMHTAQKDEDRAAEAKEDAQIMALEAQVNRLSAEIALLRGEISALVREQSGVARRMA